MNSADWLEDLTTWLEGFPWRWFCTLTLRPGISRLQARSRLLHWGQELGAALGTPDFGWLGVPENGATGLHFHFHVLICGLRSGLGAAERLHWMKRWWHLAGDAQVDDFKPGVGGVRYIAKTLTLQNFEGVEFHLATRPAFVAKSDARSLDSNSE